MNTRSLWGLPQILTFILIILLSSSVTATNDVDDFIKGNKKASKVDLFQSFEKFSNRDPKMLTKLNSGQVAELVNHVRASGWLQKWANDVNSDELDAIFGTKSTTMTSAAMPLLNLIKVESLESLSPDALILLWKCTVEVDAAPFKITKLTEMKIDHQIDLLPQVPIEMRLSFHPTAIQSFITTDRCDLFDIKLLKDISENVATLLSADCLSKLVEGESVTIPPKAIAKMPENAFSKIDPSKLTAQTIANMTSTQLAYHFQHWAPSMEKIKTIKSEKLHQAIQLLTKEKLGSFSVSADLLINMPVSAMKYFNAAFWTNVDHTKVWQLSSTHLINLPIDAFSSVHPQILENMIIKSISDSHKSSETLGLLIANMGKGVKRDDGSHPCLFPKSLIMFMAPSLTKHITADCIEAMDPATFILFNRTEHLNNFTEKAVDRMNAYQLGKIPSIAFSNTPKTFIKSLMTSAAKHYTSDEAANVSCAGFTAEQISLIRGGSSWSLFNLECLNVLSEKAIAAIPKEGFVRIPPAIFTKMAMPSDEIHKKGDEVMAQILSKSNAEQLEKLGEQVGTDDSLHPCSGISIPWATIGEQNHTSYIKKLSPRCFALLDPISYADMGKGSIGKMNEKILSLITSSERFAAIPPDALYGITKEQISYIQTGVLETLSQEHILAMASNHSTKYLKPELVTEIPNEIFETTLVEKHFSLGDNALARFKISNFTSRKWISEVGDKFTPLQWNNLGNFGEVEGYAHPCSVLEYEDVELGTGKNKCIHFWQGINAPCLAALGFLDKLSEKELLLVPDVSFTKLSDKQRAAIAPFIVDRNDRIEYAKHCEKYPPDVFASLKRQQYETLPEECYAKLSPAVWAVFPYENVKWLPEGAFKNMDKDIIKVLGTNFLEQMSDLQWKALAQNQQGLGCEGFVTDQTLAIRLNRLSQECMHYLPIEVMPALSKNQFNNIPKDYWEESIASDQIKSMPLQYFSDFEHFNRLGIKWDRLSMLHPCKGITGKHIKLMDDHTRLEYKKACDGIDNGHSTLKWIKFSLAVIGISLMGITVIACLVYRFWWLPRKVVE